MSEFRVASEHVDTMEKEIQIIESVHERFALFKGTLDGRSWTSDDQQAIRQSCNLLAHVQQLVQGECKELVQKLRARCEMVDPVTNAPRFGPKMMQKVQSLLERFDRIHGKLFITASSEPPVAAASTTEAEAPPLIPSELVLRAQQLWHHVEEIARMQQQQQQEQQQEQEALLRQQMLLQQEEERQKRLAQQQKEQEEKRVQELARLAQEKRERKKQLEEQRALINQAHRKRIVDINKRVQNPCKDTLEQAAEQVLARIATASLSPQEIKKTQRNALQTLFLFMENIVSKPENTVFRTIRKQNEHYQRDLGRYDVEDACLLSIGFKLKRVSKSDTLTGIIMNALKGVEHNIKVNMDRALTPASEMSLVSDLAEFQPEEDTEEDVFFLEEPDLQSDLDGWSNWFDNLKEMKEWIEHKLTLIK